MFRIFYAVAGITRGEIHREDIDRMISGCQHPETFVYREGVCTLSDLLAASQVMVDVRHYID